MFCSDGNIPGWKRSMNDVISSMLSGKWGATSNYTCVCMSSEQRCMKIRLSDVSGCFVVIRREGDCFVL